MLKVPKHVVTSFVFFSFQCSLLHCDSRSFSERQSAAENFADDYVTGSSHTCFVDDDTNMAIVKKVGQSSAVHSIFWGLLLLVAGLAILAGLSVRDWLKSRKDSRKIGSFLSLNPSKTNTNLTDVLEDIEGADRTSRDVIVTSATSQQRHPVEEEKTKINGNS